MPVPSDSLRAYLEKSSTQYHDQLSPDVSAYLATRGLDEGAMTRFRLGAVVDPLPGHEQYTGCLSIPYLTPSGSVTSVRFRNLSGSGPKYMTVAGDKPRLFNTEALERGTRGICVTEGEIDAITADMCGLPTIGVPGASSWQPVWARLIGQYDFVYTLSDDDEPGQEFAHKIGRASDNARNVVMTGGDVNTFFLEHGAEELRRKVGIR